MIFPGCNQQLEHRSNETLADKVVVSGKTELFDLLLDSSRLEGKNLFLVFSFQACSICRMFENYHNDSIVSAILSQYFIIKKIDYYRTPGGKELYSTYGQVGFPSWTIIDSTKLVIADSGGLNNRPGNIGFPASEKERKYYLIAVKKAAPSITKPEEEILLKKLKEFRPDRVE